MHFRPFYTYCTGIDLNFSSHGLALLSSRQPLNGAEGYRRVNNYEVQLFNPSSVRKAMNWRRRGDGDTGILLNSEE